jgi:hypothetical protein
VLEIFHYKTIDDASFPLHDADVFPTGSIEKSITSDFDELSGHYREFVLPTRQIDEAEPA